ncbi:MAG TPA: hypothetical protein IAB02_01225 [Candidatus Pullichristensenella excrementigallinarum]|uniref:Uncharacterized protein n=1 Tax=Candidatus Pullichristensenella excrementigallinarum TaxID=2840907 RepID=A0A9D1LB98_9FIRM|nr:hypothetical protein [Candidatus Pullichristensenella excrementigallinarum]
MAANDGGRFRGSTSSAYSPNMRKPGRRWPATRRALGILLLCVFLPPIGILYLWKAGVYRVRGRLLMTFVAGFSFCLMVMPLMHRTPPQTISPNPVVPQAATPVPETDVVTALSNMEEIIAAQQASESTQVEEGEVAPAQEPAATEGPTEEELLETIVYSVRSGAKYYHSSPTCGTQQNSRSLTLREALAELLAACPNCNPPTLS